MKNKVYYGEYTLKHWINLMLRKNIILPPYQRCFVWRKEKIIKLAETLRREEFIPPVTIGIFGESQKKCNLILDGQQRLTSILLIYLNLIPNFDAFKATEADVMEIEGLDDADEFGSNNKYILDWTFPRLFDLGDTKDLISKANTTDRYSKLFQNPDEFNEEFFKGKFLGFSYIVPEGNNSIEQQKFYSAIFRNINIQGESLLPQESRNALYFFNDKMTTFFRPNFCNKIKLKNSISAKLCPLDFVRYMALVSEYNKENSEYEIASGFRMKMEQYYESYIYSVLNENNETKFGIFYELFPNNEYKSRIQKLSGIITKIGLNEYSPFPSVIDLDYFMFGLLYVVMFKNKTIPDNSIENLKTEIEENILRSKSNELEVRAPNAFKYMRPRVRNSITIYMKYAI